MDETNLNSSMKLKINLKASNRKLISTFRDSLTFH